MNLKMIVALSSIVLCILLGVCGASPEVSDSQATEIAAEELLGSMNMDMTIGGESRGFSIQLEPDTELMVLADASTGFTMSMSSADFPAAMLIDMVIFRRNAAGIFLMQMYFEHQEPYLPMIDLVELVDRRLMELVAP